MAGSADSGRPRGKWGPKPPPSRAPFLAPPRCRRGRDRPARETDGLLDPKETSDLSCSAPEETARLRAALDAFVASVAQSRAGQDYPEGKVDPSHPTRRMWHDIAAYKPYFDEWRKMPAYSEWLARHAPE
jgi:hypothetical protein